MLDALAVELHQELFDLPGALGGFLVERDADHAVRRGHGLGGQPGVLALDVEVADLAEVEQLLVEVRPVGHAAAVHVVGEVVDDLQARALGVAVHAFDELEVDVVDRRAFAEAVDQVQRRTADALDRRQAQFHRPGGNLDGLGAQGQCTGIGLVGVLHAEGHAAHGGPVFSGEVGGLALGLVVEDQVDLALAIQVHVLGTVGGHLGEAHGGEHRLKDVGGGGGEFDELEAHQAHGVFKDVGHGMAPRIRLRSRRERLKASVGRSNASRRRAGHPAHTAREVVADGDLESEALHGCAPQAGLSAWASGWAARKAGCSSARRSTLRIRG